MAKVFDMIKWQYFYERKQIADTSDVVRLTREQYQELVDVPYMCPCEGNLLTVFGRRIEIIDG